MLINAITRFARNEEGTVAVVVSLVLTLLVGCVAFGIDIASLYRDRAELQSVSDLTAMTSVANHDAANDRAILALSNNNRTEEALHILQTGRFLRNPEVAQDARFTPLDQGSPGINAVQVTLREDAAIHFGRIFTEDTHVGLTRVALATRTGAASFSLSSHVARLDAFSLNDLLFQSFNVNANLSAGDVDVLADAQVNLGDLLEQLADDTGLGSRNPAEILNAETTVGDLISALQSVLPSGVGDRLSALASGTGGVNTPVAAIVGGIDTELGLTVAEFAGEIEVSALDIVTALATADNSEYALDASTGAAVPGVVSVTAEVASGAPPADSGRVALGEEGVQLHTAAARIRTDIEVNPDLLGVLGVGVSATNLRLPLYTELAGSSATLEDINCAGSSPDDLAARFSTSANALHPANGTSVAALYLGEITQAAFEDGPINPSDLGYTDFLDVNVVVEIPLLPDLVVEGITLQARSHVTVGQSQVDHISFTRGDVANGDTTRGFGSGQVLETTVSDLLSPANMDIRVKPGQESLIGGLVGPVLDGVLAALPGQVLSGALAPVDGVLDSVLAGLGLRIGEGELTLTGHHCEPVRLVQ